MLTRAKKRKKRRAFIKY